MEELSVRNRRAFELLAKAGFSMTVGGNEAGAITSVMETLDPDAYTFWVATGKMPWNVLVIDLKPGTDLFEAAQVYWRRAS